MSAPPIIQDTNRVAVFGSQLLGVLIVIGTVLTQQGELHSWRPTGTKTQPAAQEDQNGDKFARLWEDPLEDLPTFQAGAPSPSPTPAAQNQGVPAPLASGSVKYTFLWNIVDARPLPEVTERRLRTRYALVSAILADGYLPLRESVLSPLFEAGPETLPARERKLVGRFETFRKANPADPKEWPYVSVIWTPKQSTKLPIDSGELDRIKKAIREKDIGVSQTSAEGEVWFLHHGNSEDLSKFSADAASPSPPPNISFLRATIPLKRLPIPPPAAWASLQKIMTDDALVKSLVAELSLRVPALNDPCKAPRVVVFTESDTTYSKAITAEFADQLKDKKVALETYSYLRALDGRPDEPRIPETGEGSKSQGPAASLLQRRAISETSFGTSQFDYLRRIAVDLKGKRNRPKANVVAVGILGSDIYDKMLVLQAVRPALPSAIFFTTDLDALYLERAMQPFTRSLVVASADDLDVNERGNSANDRWKLPPMRDSYQTVLVKHLRSILGSQDASKQPPSARIFEIAAGKRVDVTGAGEISWPMWWLAQGWFNLLIFVPALGNAFLILWAVTAREKANPPPGPMKKWAQPVVYGEAILAGLGLLFLLWKLIFAKSDLLFGEPLSLGISIWPSVMIRLLAFVVAIMLLCLASYSFAACGLPQKDDLKEALAGRIQFQGGWLNAWFRLAASISRLFRRRPNKGGGPNPESFDHFFEVLFSPSTQRCRIVIISILYLLFSFFLFMRWPPMVPARGAPAFLIEKIVLALGVALYIIHLVFCLDLHMCALSLLRAIHAHFQSEHEETVGKTVTRMLTSLSTLTMVIGKTLLYPLTVLILIILSRLDIFDNWVMTPSLVITFALGAIVLIGASLHLWLAGAGLKRAILAQNNVQEKERKALEAVHDGVFAAWYSQPIFSAILSALAVFGSLTIAEPLARLLFTY